jgi:hypothetical protein
VNMGVKPLRYDATIPTTSTTRCQDAANPLKLFSWSTQQDSCHARVRSHPCALVYFHHSVCITYRLVSWPTGTRTAQLIAYMHAQKICTRTTYFQVAVPVVASAWALCLSIEDTCLCRLSTYALSSPWIQVLVSRCLAISRYV